MDILYKIPDNWVWTTLEQIADMTSGGTPSRTKKEYWNGNINWLKSGELKDTYIHEVEEKITEDGLKGSSAKIFPKDTLLMAMYGATVGRLGILNVDSSTNQAVCAIFNHHKLFVNEYLFFYLLSMRQKMLKDSFGGAQPNLSQGYIKSIDIPFAPLNEQKRIVAKIEKLFSNLDNSDKYLLHLEKQLKRYRQSVLKSAFEGELTKEWREKQTNLETADELLEKIKIERTLYIENELREKFKDKPEKWIKDKVKNEVDKFDNLIKKTSILNNNLWINIPLEAITTLLGDGLHGTPKYVESSEYYFINGNNLQQGKIVIKSDTKFVSQEEYLKYKKNMNNNTILVSINGTLGNVAFYDNEQVMLGKSACYFNLINSINKYYIFWKINSQDFREYADKSATGSTIKNLPLSAMRNYKLPICSILEQQEIVNQIKKHFSIIDKLETVVQQSIKESKRLRQSILKQAFEGKLVEQNPNDKSASVLLEKIAKAKEEYQKAQKKQVRKK
ncbi:restriction endonuclease subunit S [Aliarcobacter butzleri]|uniref:restriction endonuclease subunit S n=1 Tax=Aliarcobacter butzleri TaxID=28197 RepID=UPI001EDD5550|nr:restriction endonuclease subunit S [Aliarcobacter butzleri]MCG3669268.1 restriction endonuclease subunit S [Aliarcobacter butzleri]MCT7557612.1 restriction endonuclease subunit S [Aliarcobacter butzleri]MCT7631174.1 restriction endonuclease subunit S [Aliarcobacter butzleri]